MTARIIAKWTLLLSGIGIFLATVLLGAIYLLLATQAGSSWLLHQALRFQNNNISWQSLEGTLMDGLRLTDVHADLPDMTVSANNLAGKWDLLSILGGQLQIEQLHSKDLRIIVNNKVNVTTTSPWPTISSPFPININDLSFEQTSLHTEDIESRIEAIRFSGSIGLLAHQIKSLSLRYGEHKLDIIGKIGIRPPYKLNINLAWEARLQDGEKLDGFDEIKGDLAKLKVKHRSTTPFALNLSGIIDTGFNPKQAMLDWTIFTTDLKGKWQIEHWGKDSYNQDISSAGQLHLKGSVDKYRVQSEFDLITGQTNALPKLLVALNATGNRESVSFEKLTIASDATDIQAQGNFTWKDNPSWDLALNGKRINPGYFWPDWAGDISANVHALGALTPQGLILEAQIDRMEGTLRGYPLSVFGQVGYDSGTFSATGLQLKQGNNQLVLDASFEQELQARWTLTANDLAAIYPGLKGKVQSQGTLRGTLQNPQFNAEISAQSLAYDDHRISLLQGKLSSQTKDTYLLHLEVSDLITGTQNPIQLSLMANGGLASHHFDLSAKQTDLALRLSGKGDWHNQQWLSEIILADIDSKTLGQWRLAKETQFSLHKDQVEIKQACWIMATNELCTEGLYSTNTGVSLAASIHRLQLDTLNPYLPEEARLSGELKGAITLSGVFDQLNGTLNLSTDNAHLVLNQLDKKPNQVELRAISLAALLKDNRLSFTGKGRLLETGFVEARLDYPLNQPEAPLSGDITAQLRELGWLDPFVDFLSDLNGQADVAIQLAGTPNQPLIRGDVRLEKLSAFVPRLGVNLKNGALFLSHQQLQDWTLTGQLDSGEGSMRVDGTATVNSLTDWQSRLTIDGQALQTLGLENIKAQISPNLVVEADAQTLKVNGKIDIPQAEINLKELPASTVSVSKDEIILDTPNASDRQQSALAIYTDIDLVLGKQISFKGFGITGDMTGSLRLREEPERPLRIDGIVEIPKGFYKAYGQKLTINPGRLIFQGAPDNPAIDVRASRQIGEGFVGIHIGGTAEALVSELYAIPPLPPTETMALLITGKSLNSATQADASVLMSAVTSLGITQSAGLTQRLQRSFGLDVLSLSSNGGIEQSAVTIGKYLTPKLFISYVQDILTPNASVNLEYSLSKKLKIKAESGDSQSMDILYRIER